MTSKVPIYRRNNLYLVFIFSHRFDCNLNDNVVKIVTIGKGKCLSMIELSTSPYHTFEKYGMEFINDTIDINDDSQEKIMKYADSVGQKFKHSFTILTLQNTPKFIVNEKPNRWVMAVSINNEISYIWNNIEKQLQLMVRNLNPPIQNLKEVSKNDVDRCVNVLMSEPRVDQPQQAHADMTLAFKLGTNTKHFHVV